MRLPTQVLALALAVAWPGGCATVDQPIGSGDAGGECTASTEQCNGRDDDCDGQVDEEPQASASCALPNAAALCAAGQCTVGRCNSGWGDCDGVASNGCEQNLNAPSDCGACGRTCADPTPLCEAGACVPTCSNPAFVVCAGTCVDATTDPLNCGGCGTPCALAHSTPTCAAGLCVLGACGAGWDDCDGTAANGCETSLATSTDCGGCGVACTAPTPVCEGGTCTNPCGTRTFCSGSCVDLGTDLANCGACGRPCNPDHALGACVGGGCTVSSCRAGWEDCDGAASNGCETVLGTDSNCSGCGAACLAPTPVCDSSTGTCIPGCPPLTDCGGSCVDLMTDSANCGTCGNACALPHAGAACVAGGCTVASCDTGWRDCDAMAATGCETALGTASDCADCGDGCTGTTPVCDTGACSNGCADPRRTLCTTICADLAADPANCGACGNVCTLSHATAGCVASVCAVDTCDTGWGDCDGVAANGCEVALGSAANCGVCGRSCSGSTPLCAGGICAAMCLSSETNCSGTCADTQTDVAHCGSCTTPCNFAHATAACTAGACGIVACDAGWDNCDGLSTNGCETSLTTLTNCGGCGSRCLLAHAAEACTAGACVLGACDTGWGDCDGVAANGCEQGLTTSEIACGGCGLSCPTGAFCAAGACDLGLAIVKVAAGGTQFWSPGPGRWEQRGHSCAVRASGQVVCWGHNGYGQLGDGTATTPASGVAVTVLSAAGVPLTDVVDIDAGDDHNCVLRQPSGGPAEIVCWGRNVVGELGDGTLTARRWASTPVALPADAGNPVQVSTAANHTCAVTDIGRLYCWGGNGLGQLGDGTTTGSATPVWISAVADALEVAAGGELFAVGSGGTLHARTCVSTAADVQCWGEQPTGDGTTTSSTTPRTVSLPGGWPGTDSIASTGRGTCVVGSGDSLGYCWGFGLGPAATLSPNTPLRRDAPTLIARIAADDVDPLVCARKSTGHLACWGLYNSYGQCGTGAVGSACDGEVFGEVFGLTNVIHAAAGGWHVCAALSTGTVSCWGLNNTGQLGDGTLANRSVPVQVLNVP